MGSKCRILRCLPYMDFVVTGGICVLQTHLVFITGHIELVSGVMSTCIGYCLLEP